MTRSGRIFGGIALCLVLLASPSGGGVASAASSVAGSGAEMPTESNRGQSSHGPTRLWMVESLGQAADRSAVAIGELVYIATPDGVVALDPRSGEERWRAGMPTLYILTYDLASNVVFVTERETGKIIGFDGASGAQLWAVTPSEPSRPAAANDGTLYTSSVDPGALHALDAASGEERWRYPTEPTTTIDLIAGGTVFATASTFEGTNKSKTLALDAESGVLRWETEIEEGVSEGLAATDDLVLVGRDTLIARDIATGEERWTSPIASFAASAVIGDGRVYLGTDAGVAAVDLATGSTVWQLPAEFSASVAAVDQGTVYGDIDGDAVALDAATGEEIWRVDLHSAAVGAVAAGVVYVGMTGIEPEGTVTALDAASGQMLWQLDAAGWTEVIGIVSGVIITLDDGGIVAGIGSDAAAGEAASPVAAATPATAADAADGSNYLGRAGAVQTDPGPTGIPEQFWIVELTEPDAYLIGDDAVFAGTLDGVVALDLVTRQERWRAPVGWATSFVLEGDDLFVGTRNDLGPGSLSALDAANGEVTWTVEGTHEQIVVSALVDGWLFGVDSSYFGGSSSAVAWGAATGEVSWRYESDDGAEFGISLIAGGAAYLGCDPTRLNECNTDAITALDAATGEMRWRVTTERPAGVVAADANRVYAIDDYDGFHALGQADGAVVWQTDPNITGVTFDAVVHGVVYGTDQGAIVEWDARTGDELRRSEDLSVEGIDGLGDDRVYTSASAPDYYAVVSVDQSTLHAVWQYPAQGGLFDPEVVAITSDLVYVVDSFELYAVDTATGQNIWQFGVDDDIDRVVIRDGVIVISAGSELTAIGDRI